MNIELRSVGTAIGNVASGVSKAGASLDAMFGPKIGPVSLPMNEGPVGGGFLEGFRPMNIADITTIDPGGTVAPLGEILFQAKPESTVASVENFLAQPRMPQIVPMSMPEIAPLVAPKTLPLEFVMPQTEPMVAPWALPLAEPMAGPAVEAQSRLRPATQTESRISAAPARNASHSVAGGPAQNPTVLPQPLLQEQEEKEEVITRKEVVERIDTPEEEEINKVIKRHVIDDSALAQVVVEAKQALAKAQELAKKLGLKLTGELVSRFMPGQHSGNESEAVKGKGPDGSIPERRQSTEELGELSGVNAEEKVVSVAYGKPPIKIRPEGQQVKDEDIQRVYKYHRVKPKALMEVVTRVIKKKKLVAQMGHETIEVPIKTAVPEKKIEDYPQLAGVFPKAA